MSQESILAFWQYYQAYISPHPPAARGSIALQLWNRFADSLPADRIEQLMRYMADHWAERGGRRPMLRDFQRVWQRISPSISQAMDVNCEACSGSGWVQALVVFDSQNEPRYTLWELSSDAKPIISSFYCLCQAAPMPKNEQERKLREAVLDWRRRMEPLVRQQVDQRDYETREGRSAAWHLWMLKQKERYDTQKASSQTADSSQGSEDSSVCQNTGEGGQQAGPEIL